MKIKYLCPYWGQEHTDAKTFLTKVSKAGYDGIEINIGAIKNKKEWLHVLSVQRNANPEFVLVGQLVLDDVYTSSDSFQKAMEQRFQAMLPFHPKFINSHTGKDFFSFKDNCKMITFAEKFSRQYGIPVYHETHRGRFSFAAHTMPPFLKKFPKLGVVADYSHWCNVSESMLQHQSAILKLLLPHIRHLHARVGWEHGPQIANPFLKANANYLKQFTNWWLEILRYQKQTGCEQFTICLEAGPPPYMPLQNNQKPLADQWKINIKMMQYLREIEYKI